MNKTKLGIQKYYSKAEKSIKIGRRKYFLYCALSRKEKHFKDLVPLMRERQKEIKILLDINSDICLVYGSKEVLRLMRKRTIKWNIKVV